MTFLLLALLAFTAREAWRDLGGKLFCGRRGVALGKLCVVVRPRWYGSPSVPEIYICWDHIKDARPWEVPFRWYWVRPLAWPVRVDVVREFDWGSPSPYAIAPPDTGMFQTEDRTRWRRIIGLRIDYGWPLALLRRIHVFRLPTLRRRPRP